MVLIQITKTQGEYPIFTIRGLRVMLDSDLAKAYGVFLKRLNEQVKRNPTRFPTDFAFQLTTQEVADLRSQIATTSGIRSQFATASKRNIRYRPWAFTEHGALMLASVLNSPIAIEASVRVVRAFVLMREQLAAHGELSSRLAELENRVGGHDEAIQDLFAAIRQLLDPSPGENRKEIGFHVREMAPRYRVRPRKRF